MALMPNLIRAPSHLTRRACSLGRLSALSCLTALGLGLASPCATLWARSSPQEQPRWELTQWGLNDGLPQSSVTGIVAARDGRLWVSTFAGLAHFDGVSFELWRPNTGSAPIRLTHMINDPLNEGHIWISTDGEGLWRLRDATSPERVEVERVPLPKGYESTVIYDLTASTVKGRAGLWLSTEQGTLWRQPNGSWELSNAKADSRSSELEPLLSTFELDFDERGDLWSCSAQHLYKRTLDGTFTALIPPTHGLEDPVKSLPTCRGGVSYQNFYIALFEEGLWLLSSEGEWWELKARAAQGQEAKRFKGSWKERPWLSEAGELWLMSDTQVMALGDVRELIKSAQAGEPIEPVRYQLSHPGRVIYTEAQGRGGEALWIGTTGGGLYRLSSLGFSEITWPGSPELSEVGPIAQTSQELWFVQGYNTLWRRRAQGGVVRFEELKLPPAVKNQGVTAIGARARGDVLIAREEQLLSLQRGEGRFVEALGSEELSGLGKLSLIQPMAQGAQPYQALEGWWLGTQGGELATLMGPESLERVLLPAELSSSKLLSLIEIKSTQAQGELGPPSERDIAIGHALGVSVRRGGVWRSYHSRDGLPRGDIRALFEAENGVIWLASYGGGIGWISPQGELGVIDVYDAHLSSIHLTPDQSLWLQGNKGLTRVRLSDLERHRQGATEPLVTELFKVGEANGWVRNSAVISEEGALALAGVSGLSVIQTTALMSSAPLPAPKLLSARLGDHELTLPKRGPHDSLSYEATPQDAFRRLEVHYLTSHLKRNRGIAYEHRLIMEGEGGETEQAWLSAGSSKVLSYGHLRPGRYKLQLRSVSLEYAPSEVTELGFIVSHKWYELLWVRLMFGLAFILIPTSLSLWRARLIGRHNRRLRVEMERRGLVEARLREREAHYRHVFNEAANAFLLYTEDGECIEVNEQAIRLFNTSRAELLESPPRLLGLPPLEHWPGQDLSDDTPLLCAKIDGGRFPARMSVVRCVVDPQSAEGVWLVSVMDLSAIVSAHEQQTWVMHQLSVARRLDALGRLSSGIAHDLNNILGALSGNIELLGDEFLEGDSFIEESFQDIKECLSRGSSLSQQLLAFSRAKTHKERTFLNPTELLKGLEKLLHRLMPQGVSLHLDLQETGELKLNQGLFEQILLTLTLHAAEASPAEGEVQISIGSTAQGALQLSVQDQGPPIPLSALSALLEREDEFEDNESQLGPALTSVHRWMREIDGHFTVSRLEHRNQVLVTWPSSELTPMPLTRQRSSRSKERTYRLAVVDDNHELRRVLVRQLTNLGHEVESYGDPLEALDQLKERAEMPDILISDVIMPGLNGRQLATELRRVFPELRVIFISGYTSDVLGEVNTEGRRELLLHKPFSKKALQSHIERLMENEAPEA